MERERVEAQVSLDQLDAGRDAALDRIFVPWHYAVGWAIGSNVCLLPVVLPIVISSGWVLLVQGIFLTVSIALLVSYRRHRSLQHPEIRVQGDWIVNVGCFVGFAGALALGIYARTADNVLLGASALAINSATYLLMYRGQAALVRHQVSRRT